MSDGVLKLMMFSVYDAAADCYLRPFTFGTEGEAIRAFVTACRDEDHAFYQHAEDYTLFCIGEFDQDTGVIQPRTPRSLGNAVQYKLTRPPKMGTGYGLEDVIREAKEQRDAEA